MKNSGGKVFFSYIALLCLCVVISMPAYAVIDADAAVVRLRKSCTEAGSALDNCFENITDLEAWMWITRDPTESDPLIVDIGPGTFTDQLNCDIVYTPIGIDINPNRGHVTFRGSGRDSTIIGGNQVVFAAIGINGCEKLVFQDLTVKSNVRAIVWSLNMGGSSWVNVKVDAGGEAWYDDCTPGANTPRHDWFSSTIITRHGGGDRIAYRIKCSENWFWGSDLAVLNNGEAGAPNNSSTLHVLAGKAFLFGTSLRNQATANAIATAPNGQIGITVIGGGTVHMHGGIISVKHDNPANDQDVIGVLSSGAGSSVHTPDTAYALKAAGNGTATRVVVDSGGKAVVPFNWGSGTTPPSGGSSADLVSDTGQDLFVETDCSSGGCQTSGTESHLLIYDDRCATAGPWFDVVTGACRGL